jgi:3-mercaptopyruvate sulfurtransferase SseA
MRLRIIYFVMVFAAAVIFAACNAVDHVANSNTKPIPQSPQTAHADGARRVTVAELEAMMKDGTALVVDVRSQDAYDLGHIPGARLIPAGEILNHIGDLPRDKTIVTYCS